MIKSVTLKNFRQHHDLSLTFSDGVTVVRGANEAGKSTVFEAITFALFGIRACRNNDVTSWGADPGSHAVTVTFTTAGIDYNLKRSPRGAEITWDGGRVTGQTEVTRYCEEVLELKPGTGNKLMFVGQNAMRGILSEGGAKTSSMIEQLADFDQLESWITTLQTEFSTGRTDLMKQAVEGLRQQLVEAQNELTSLPDAEAEAARIRAEYEQQEVEYSRRSSELTDKRQKLEAELEQSLEQEQVYNGLRREQDIINSELSAERRRLQGIRHELDVLELSMVDFGKCEKSLESLQQRQVVWADYLVAKGYQQPEDAVFDIDREGVQGWLNHATAAVTETRDKIASLEGEARTLSRNLHTSLECPTCNRAWDNAAQLEEANDRTRKQIEGIQSEVAQLQAALVQPLADSERYRRLLAVSVPEIPEGSRWQEEGNWVPPKLVWAAEIPTPVTQREVNEARTKLDDERRKHERCKIYAADSEAITNRLTELTAQLMPVTKQLESCVVGRASKDVHLALNDVQHEMQDVQTKLSDIRHTLENFDELVRPMFERQEKLAARVETLKGQILDGQAAVQDTELNNTLLKTLRTLKPQITDKVWRTVCSTISHYFSLMRGQQSVVSKGEGGFEVDGRDVTSLSGSTLDILGIAIRVALTKTFMPGCRFLFLDEPFAACDAERQTQALGFITSIGFDQVIVVTHEDVTEAVADHLVTL